MSIATAVEYRPGTMSSRTDPPPPPSRLRHFLHELAESLRDLGSIGKACTCGDPRRYGPCPRHGKLY